MSWATSSPQGSPNREKMTALCRPCASRRKVLDRIDLMPMLYDPRKLPKGSEMIKSKKNLDVCDERLADRPCFKATIPPAPPGR